MTGRAPQQGAKPGQQLLGMEGLGQIVVGPGVEARDLVRPGAARRQDQDRRGATFAPPAFQNRDPVNLGQAQIQHDRIIGFGVAQEMRLFAVTRVINGIAGIRQGRLQLA